MRESIVMSRGPGNVQRQLIAVLQGEPLRRFTVEELAALAYPDRSVGRAQLVSVRRALNGLDVGRQRIGLGGKRGWRFSIRYAK